MSLVRRRPSIEHSHCYQSRDALIGFSKLPILSPLVFVRCWVLWASNSVQLRGHCTGCERP